MNNEPSSASQHNPFHGSDSDDIDADDGFTDAQRATMMRMRGMNIPMQEATTDAPMQPEDTNAPPVPLGEDGLPRQLTSIDLIARCMDSAKLRAAKERCELVLRRLVSSTYHHHLPVSTPYNETHPFVVIYLYKQHANMVAFLQEAMSDEKQNEFVSIRDSPYSYFSMQLWREALTTCYEKWQEVDHMFKNHVDIYGIVLNQLNKVYNIEADMEMIDMLKQRERQTLRELQIQRLGRERAVTARVLEQLNERLQRTELAVNEVEMVRKEENYF